MKLKKPWVLTAPFVLVEIAAKADTHNFTMDALSLSVLEDAVLLYKKARRCYPTHVAWSSFQSDSIERRSWYADRIVLPGYSLEAHLSWRVRRNTICLWRESS